jgi:TetR/AcrR family transcriptional repressor of nem operon
MARPIEFCREKALQSAIEVFWGKGYEAASLEDLVTAMGIGRQSLYNTYGDKRGLFIQAVATQIENYADSLRQHFQQNKPVQQLFASWFHGMSQRCEKQKRLGCLLVNTSMELAGRDQEIADLMVRNQRNQEDTFCRALEHAVEKGELKADYDCRKIARYLVGCAAGMIVIAKADPNSPNLDAMASVALQILDP